MNKTYGCHNRAPFKPFHLPTGAENDRKHRIPHVMTTACQYRHTELGKTDPKCTDCKHREAS